MGNEVIKIRESLYRQFERTDQTKSAAVMGPMFSKVDLFLFLTYPLYNLGSFTVICLCWINLHFFEVIGNMRLSSLMKGNKNTGNPKWRQTP